VVTEKNAALMRKENAGRDLSQNCPKNKRTLNSIFQKKVAVDLNEMLVRPYGTDWFGSSSCIAYW